MMQHFDSQRGLAERATSQQLHLFVALAERGNSWHYGADLGADGQVASASFQGQRDSSINWPDNHTSLSYWRPPVTYPHVRRGHPGQVGQAPAEQAANNTFSTYSTEIMPESICC